LKILNRYETLLVGWILPTYIGTGERLWIVKRITDDPFNVPVDSS
jgi:hypothetical protein